MALPSCWPLTTTLDYLTWYSLCFILLLLCIFHLRRLCQRFIKDSLLTFVRAHQSRLRTYGVRSPVVTEKEGKRRTSDLIVSVKVHPNDAGIVGTGSERTKLKAWGRASSMELPKRDEVKSPEPQTSSPLLASSPQVPSLPASESPFIRSGTEFDLNSTPTLTTSSAAVTITPLTTAATINSIPIGISSSSSSLASAGGTMDRILLRSTASEGEKGKEKVRRPSMEFPQSSGSGESVAGRGSVKGNQESLLRRGGNPTNAESTQGAFIHEEELNSLTNFDWIRIYFGAFKRCFTRIPSLASKNARKQAPVVPLVHFASILIYVMSILMPMRLIITLQPDWGCSQNIRIRTYDETNSMIRSTIMLGVLTASSFTSAENLFITTRLHVPSWLGRVHFLIIFSAASALLGSIPPRVVTNLEWEVLFTYVAGCLVLWGTTGCIVASYYKVVALMIRFTSEVQMNRRGTSQLSEIQTSPGGPVSTIGSTMEGRRSQAPNAEAVIASLSRFKRLMNLMLTLTLIFTPLLLWFLEQSAVATSALFADPTQVMPGERVGYVIHFPSQILFSFFFN